MRNQSASLFASLLSLCFVGCGVDLGECDDALAKTVYYDGLGEPAYSGQALMTASCGGAGGFCHVSSARGAQRFGVPAGYDFDLVLASDTASTDVLRRGIERVRDDREDIYSSVESGRMPTVESFHANVAAYQSASRDGLPALNTDRGKTLLRNWLACGAPVVERTTERPSGVTPVGDVVASAGVRLSPTWDSLHANVIGPACAQCHSGSGASVGLDLEDIDVAYDSLVGDGSGEPAIGPACVGGDRVMVVPGDPAASLLMHKLEGVDDGGEAVCGSRMPLGNDPLEEATIHAFRTWIENGASREGT
jgi:hypothetical protein